MLPTCAGRLLEREVKQLDNILTVAKSPFTVVLGGAKVDDRLKAIKLLIKKESIYDTIHFKCKRHSFR